jgi:oxygen-dependent protoporphyrinogen oxidase
MTEPIRKQALVVGAGISGLTAARQLKKAGVDVALVESQDKVGGAMQSERRDGFILEKGPFNVLVRDDAFHELLLEAGDEVGPVRAADEANARYLYKDGGIHMVPMGMRPMMTSPLLSFGAKVKVMLGMFFSKPADKPEPTVHEAAERRLGREVADVFISSIISGVYGGDSRKLSLKAVLPKAHEFDQTRRCPLLYEVEVLKRKKKMYEAHPERKAFKGLVSFEGGLQSLGDWLAARLGDDLHLGCTIESIEKTDGGYRVVGRKEEGECAFECEHLILATPHAATARLIRDLAPAAAEELDGINDASLVVLNLAYPRGQVGHDLAGYGFLVPMTETDLPVMGVLWADSAFPHHAPDTHRLIRIFMGGPRDPGAPERSDEELLKTATEAVQPLLEINGEPTLVDICRWPDSIPQYEVGHVERIQRVEAAVADVPGLHLVGNYLHGISINDCIRQASDFADTFAAEVSQPAEKVF